MNPKGPTISKAKREQIVRDAIKKQQVKKWGIMFMKNAICPFMICSYPHPMGYKMTSIVLLNFQYTYVHA